jgi:hypothetical protein
VKANKKDGITVQKGGPVIKFDIRVETPKRVLCMCVCVCVFLASGYRWGTVMHEIPISSAHLIDFPSIP